MFLPITLNTVHDIEVSHLTVEGTMIRNFGPWRQGEARTLTFNFDDGTCEEFDDYGRSLNKVDLFLAVKYESQ